MPSIDVPTIIGPLATRCWRPLRRDSAAVATMPPAVNARPGEVQEVPLSMGYTLIKIHGTTNEKQVSKGLTAFASCVIYFYSGVFCGPV